VFFLVPLGSLLVRAVENPEVADALPRTGQALAELGPKQPTPRRRLCGGVTDLSAIEDTAQAGVLARRLNSEVPGARSLVMGTYRALQSGRQPEGPADQAKARLLEHDARWEELPYWQAIAKNSSRWTPDYLLAAVDLKRTPQGDIVKVRPTRPRFATSWAAPSRSARSSPSSACCWPTRWPTGSPPCPSARPTCC
jgi:putative spermidine/putrescine transport system permease protein